MTETSRLNVCIMGCGRVGARLADLFDEAGHTVVSVIDVNEDAFRRLSKETLRDCAIVGDGTDPAVLRQAGIEHADIFIAVTNGDNRNIMASQLAQRIFNVQRVICRIYDPKRHQRYRKLDLESFCPTIAGANAIFGMIAGSETTSESLVNSTRE